MSSAPEASAALVRALEPRTGSSGLALDAPPFELSGAEDAPALATGPRIGISQAVDRPWRYAEAGSRFLSRPIGSSA